jgi:hypothetical protein
MQEVSSTKSNKDVVSTDSRKIHLDMVRMVCVLVWVSRHGDQRFHTNNIILDQNWSAPLLWLISGICWGRSCTPTWVYIRRLALVFCAGVALNACAWKIQNPVQQMDIWDVIYQMWFVVGLMVMTLMTSPLKLAPDAGFEEKAAAFLWSVGSPVVVICIAVILYSEAISPAGVFANSDGLHWWLQGSGFSASIPLLEFAGAQTLTAFAFTCLQRESCKSAGWLLLAYIIMTMILYKHSRVGMEAASMIVFSVGFVVERLGFYLRWRSNAGSMQDF